jgi:hypothetical protein
MYLSVVAIWLLLLYLCEIEEERCIHSFIEVVHLRRMEELRQLTPNIEIHQMMEELRRLTHKIADFECALDPRCFAFD